MDKSSSNFVGSPMPQNVDFTKMEKYRDGLHPRDAKGQYISPKPNSKRNVSLRGYRV